MSDRFARVAHTHAALMRRTLRIIALVSAFALAPTSALAAGNDVIRDCTDNGRIDGTGYGPKDYADALDNLPSDVSEYTDCASVIAAASRSGGSSSAGGGGSGGGGGGGRGGSDGGGTAGATAASKPAPKPAGPPVIPPASGLVAQPLSQGVPAPLIITIVLLGLAALAALVATVGRARPRLPAVRGVERVFPRRA